VFKQSKSLQSLIARAGGSSALVGATVFGVICAAAVPVLILIVGNIVHVLIESQASSSKPFAAWLPNFLAGLPHPSTPLTIVSLLLLAAVAVVITFALAMQLFNRQIHHAAVEFEVNLIRALRLHSERLAVMRTLSAQQTALVDGLEYHLPRIRTNLARWWRAFPRHLIQFVGCMAVAFIIQPLLTLLTAVSVGLVSLVFRLVDRSRRSGLPVVRERASQRRSELQVLCLKGPLLASVHSNQSIEQFFEAQLASYRREAFLSLTNSAWKMPLSIAAVGSLACLFVFVIAVQILRAESHLSIAGAVTFLLAVGAAVMSANRLLRSARDLRLVDTASEELEHFLALTAETNNSATLKPITSVKQQAEMEHITLLDSSGRKLLENVSVVFRPGKLIGVISSERLQAQALVELLMGFGRPISGRMLVDGTLISDIAPESLAKCSLWVGADGPLITATVEDNLRQALQADAQVDINQILKRSNSLELVQRLPDGLATLITPDDDRLPPDAAFRLGVARASLKAPSIIVLDEPMGNVDARTELETLDAIRSLVQPTSITVLIPNRLSTVRACDSIVLLHEHKVVDIGPHAELLQRSELYRHLNYLRFNPFRNLGA
jgi:ATP-binding cassette, subfamily B, bacterial